MTKTKEDNDKKRVHAKNSNEHKAKTVRPPARKETPLLTQPGVAAAAAAGVDRTPSPSTQADDRTAAAGGEKVPPPAGRTPNNGSGGSGDEDVEDVTPEFILGKPNELLVLGDGENLNFGVEWTFTTICRPRML